LSGSAQIHPDQPSASPPPRARVLLVEDEPDNRALLQMALVELSGYEVEVAHDGDGLEARVRKFRPQFVILDLMLPGRSGEELVRDLQLLRSALGFRIVVLSALPEPRWTPDGKAAWIDLFVRKPFDPLELTESLRGLARSAAMQS
jgi:DNA-binding response OmpR family regulator